MHSNRMSNLGSRLSILENQTFMETDNGEAAEEEDNVVEEDNGKSQGAASTANDAAVSTADDEANEVVKETQQGSKGEREKITLNVFHSGLAEGLRALNGIESSVQAQAHQVNVSRMKNLEKNLRDVTNGLPSKPTTVEARKTGLKMMADQKRSGVS